MAMRMLIDATHSEETRVVVVDGNQLQEFDFESSTRKQLRGNIYLARVARVEPSLQAAFVEYGGERDGFLPFSEIHPDYYQIPIADREALLAQEAAGQQVAEDAAKEEGPADVAGTEPGASKARPGDDEGEEVAGSTVEDVGGDELEEASRARRKSIRPYKIQEVIKRRQIILVQAVKEQRGTKGAALTTYLSLAGRYCVLMPNTARGGGISRKIVNATDRKRLKDIVESLAVPEGMGLIARTAGMNRSKAEIKRDFDYLIKLWDDIRETTLTSSAPSLVYEEADLIKRSIRDLYSKDIDEILIAGDEGYRSAKAFIRRIMPSRAKVVQPHRDRIPMFHRYKVEEQLEAMHSPLRKLKSGGSIVINLTEALVSIDVNSGRATKERNIEATALKTNLEAADEVARQLRLRDLSGLIVIDFIDMEASKNNRAVERRLKECLKADRARIQVGRISPFGLLEMSRQRLRPSLLEASSDVCSQCAGSGFVRSTESAALHVLRAIEQKGLAKPGGEITVRVATPVALYLLNFKRSAVAEIEQRNRLIVLILGDDALVPPEVRIEWRKVDAAATRRAAAAPRAEAEAEAESEVEVEVEVEAEVEAEAEAEAVVEAAEVPETEETGRKRRRRPRRRKRAREDTKEAIAAGAAAEGAAEIAAQGDDGEQAAEEAAEEAPAEGAAAAPRKRHRRGKRGGRRRSRATRAEDSAIVAEGEKQDVPAQPPGEAQAEAPPGAIVEERPWRESPADVTPLETRPSEAHRPGVSAAEPVVTVGSGSAVGGEHVTAPPEEPSPSAASAPHPTVATEDKEEVADEEARREPARRGWWRRSTG